jgi:hypothetical protein
MHLRGSDHGCAQYGHLAHDRWRCDTHAWAPLCAAWSAINAHSCCRPTAVMCTLCRQGSTRAAAAALSRREGSVYPAATAPGAHATSKGPPHAPSRWVCGIVHEPLESAMPVVG